MASSRGGKRRKHVPLLLLPEQVEEIRLARAASTPFKELMRRFNCSRETLSRAALAYGPYKNFDQTSTDRVKALVEDAMKWRAHIAAQEPT